MKKAKIIIKKMTARLVKSCKNIGNMKIEMLSKIVLYVAIFMVVLAFGVICFYKPARDAVFSSETHTVVAVKSGDTLWNIAKRYKTTVSDIMMLNGLENENIIVGDKLYIQRYRNNKMGITA